VRVVLITTRCILPLHPSGRDSRRRAGGRAAGLTAAAAAAPKEERVDDS